MYNLTYVSLDLTLQKKWKLVLEQKDWQQHFNTVYMSGLSPI